MLKKILPYVLYAFFIASHCQAQDVEALLKAKPKAILQGKGISMQGSINFMTRYYSPFDIIDRQVASSYILTGQLTIDLFGKVKMPMSFMYSDYSKTVMSGLETPSVGALLPPLNRLSLRPTYKGHTLFLGTNALNFSAYTLAGHRFDGIGYEYKSKKQPIYGGFMYGNLSKQVVGDTLNSYNRIGFSGKVGYKHEKDIIELILFHAQDKTAIKGNPQSNLAMSVRIQKALYKNFILDGELAHSAIFTENALQKSLSFYDKLGTVIGVSSKSVVSQALKLGIQYKKEETSFGLEYSRVDPFYETFGGYYFNKDAETIAGKSAFSLLDKKLKITTNLGLQQNNLAMQNPQKNQRWVGAFNTSYAPNDKQNFQLSYSTFLNYSNFQNNYAYLMALNPYRQLDTLNYRQTNQNLTSSFGIELPQKGNTKKAINGNVLYQVNNDQAGSATTGSSLYNASCNYTWSNDSLKLMTTVGLTTMRNASSSANEWMYGPIFGLSKNLIKDHLDLTTNLSYLLSDGLEGVNRVATTSYRKGLLLGKVNLTATIQKQHKLTFSTSYLKATNFGSEKSGENFSELTFLLNYAYSFKVMDIKFK